MCCGFSRPTRGVVPQGGVSSWPSSRRRIRGSGRLEARWLREYCHEDPVMAIALLLRVWGHRSLVRGWGEATVAAFDLHEELPASRGLMLKKDADQRQFRE